MPVYSCLSLIRECTKEKTKADNTEVTMNSHNPCKMVLIIITLIAFIATIFVNMLAPFVPGLMESTTGNVSAKYSTGLTPAGWTFSIWGVIYTWQAILLVHCLTHLCRRNGDDYLYVKPAHIPSSFYITYIINMMLNSAWIFLFDREQIEASFTVLLLIAVTLYISGVFLCRGISRAGAALKKSGMKAELWMTRIFTLNGIALYGTWCTIATLLNFIMMLHYKVGVDMVTCAWLAQGILNAEVVVWFILETFVFDKHLRYCFAPYIVLPIALAGVLYKNFDPEVTYTYYTLFLISLSGLLGIIKLIVMIVRGMRNPITYFTSDSDFEKGKELSRL